jgi:alpha-galactosidase
MLLEMLFMRKPAAILLFTGLVILLVSLSVGLYLIKSGTSITDTSERRSYDNGLAQRPLLGWSSWSSIGASVTASKIKAQAQVLARTLKSHGYIYVNLDDYWYLNPITTVDQFGRWVADPKKFPEGIDGLSRYVHSLGLKFGIYLTPGIPVAAVKQDTPIEGTKYHAQDIADTGRYETSFSFGNKMQYFINYSKPGAQAYVNSWAHLLAQWKVDFLKLDGVEAKDAPESQARANIQAWSRALRQSGRPIYFLLSGRFTIDQANLLRQNANGWRIDDDIECYATCSGRVTWKNVTTRFNDVPAWIQWARPGGWNDLDSLYVGNGFKDGLTNDERQSYLTLWAISAAPLYSGDDLTTLDEYGLRLLTNDEVINVDQQGVPARPISASAHQQVWYAREPDGSYIVALFNLGSTSASVTVRWSELGLDGSATVRDLWAHTSIGMYSSGFSTQLNVHASRLLRITSTNTSMYGLSELLAHSLDNGAKMDFAHEYCIRHRISDE